MTVGPASSSVLPPYPPPPPPSESSPRGIHIGVLALQGAFQEHLVALRRLDSPSPTLPILPRLVKTIPDLADLHGLIIPGGESTAISLLAQSQHVPGVEGSLLDHLRSWVRSGSRATWGTCAGMILLADEVVEGSMKRGGQELVGGLGIKVVRNQWGRQVRLPLLSAQELAETDAD